MKVTRGFAIVFDNTTEAAIALLVLQGRASVLDYTHTLVQAVRGAMSSLSDAEQAEAGVAARVCLRP